MKYEYERLRDVNDGPLDEVFDAFSVAWGSDFSAAFHDRFDLRFVAYPIDGYVPRGSSFTPPQYWLAAQLRSITATYAEWYKERKKQIKDAITEAVQPEQIVRRAFDAPDADPDTSFTTDMTVERREGGRPEELAHVRHLEELRNLDEEALQLFDGLFMGVLA